MVASFMVLSVLFSSLRDILSSCALTARQKFLKICLLPYTGSSTYPYCVQYALKNLFAPSFVIGSLDVRMSIRCCSSVSSAGAVSSAADCSSSGAVVSCGRFCEAGLGMETSSSTMMRSTESSDDIVYSTPCSCCLLKSAFMTSLGHMSRRAIMAPPSCIRQLGFLCLVCVMCHPTEESAVSSLCT